MKKPETLRQYALWRHVLHDIGWPLLVWKERQRQKVARQKADRRMTSPRGRLLRVLRARLFRAE